jgi:cbb3-type cytochrome oxidase subunit 3
VAENGLNGWAGHLLSNSMSSLNLAHNMFADDLAMYLPQSSKSTLTYLNVSNNLLTDTLPDELASFLSLESLDLSSNQFYGPVSGSIGPLLNLRYVMLENNQFQEVLSPIISQAQRFDELNTLSLAHNFVYGSVPDTIDDLSEGVALVDISYNQLTGELPDVELHYYVDISGNQFSCPFPSSWSSSEYQLCTSSCCPIEVSSNYTSGIDHVEIALLSIGLIVIVLLLVLMVLIIILIGLVYFVWKQSKDKKNQSLLRLLEEEDIPDPRY